MNTEFDQMVRAEALAARDLVGDMLRQIQDLALQIRTDIAIDEQPATLLRETHQISNLVGMINTQIRGYGRHWL